MTAAQAATTAGEAAAGHPPGATNETRGTVLADEVEHATSLWARFMGLMGRRSLAPGAGLWLSGSNGIHMFFMRFPIDVVFLSRPGDDGAHRVVSTHRKVRPWIGIVPFIPGAHGCLELPVGAIDASGTVRGDIVRLG